MRRSCLPQSLLLGTARHPVDTEALPDFCGVAFTSCASQNIPPLPAALSVLALLTQSHAFGLPACPDMFDTVLPFVASRPIVSDEARRQILHLVGTEQGSCKDSAGRALAQCLSRCALQLHPFDEGKLRAFRRRHHAALNERVTFLLPTNGDGTPFPVAQDINASNWSHAPRPDGLAFLAALRESDSIQARNLIAAQLPLERAEARLQLVNLLWINRTAGDRPLLEALCKDRSAEIRRCATVFLDRLPGSIRTQSQLKDFISRLIVTRSGLLRRKSTITLQLPATLEKHRDEKSLIGMWMRQDYCLIESRAIAAMLGMSTDDLATAASEDQWLMECLSVAAANDHNWAMLSKLAAHAPEPLWPFLVAYGLDELGLRSAADRRHCLEAVIASPAHQADLPITTAWHYAIERLAERCDGPLPCAQAQILSNGIINHGAHGERSLVACVTLTPAEGLVSLRHDLEARSPRGGERAIFLVDTLIRLYQEKTSS
ncbi:DUF5691 domain-containing protein [Asaia lannensis]|uniref:DUF5691 domain-containing protein n=1 Tax=Asaia lannensis NBRC 102526 TaxID=1307926 RepID=A0ABT1CC46_9PROT|nr:DUF5691 domain-containing protein [Asaia lannensis]MCO6158433.1 DUF5691 domain-containing protein [Asaia lannensis NBRC 102526]